MIKSLITIIPDWNMHKSDFSPCSDFKAPQLYLAGNQSVTIPPLPLKEVI